MEVIKGLDVSVLQGVVPYPKLFEDGYTFVFIRSKVGNNPGVDTRFQSNVQAARSAGFLVAPYAFPFPLPHLDPKKQADDFYAGSMVDGDVVGTMKGDLPPAFDLEWPPPEQWGTKNCSADQIVNWSIDCLAKMHEDWQQAPIIYSYPYFLQALSKATRFKELLQYKLWVAGGPQYVNGNGSTPRRADDGVWLDRAPAVAGWGQEWSFWQHDGNGGRKLPNGADADFNVFRGSVKDLAVLAQLEEGPPLDLTPDLPTALAVAAPIGPDNALHAYRQQRIAQVFKDVA